MSESHEQTLLFQETGYCNREAEQNLSSRPLSQTSRETFPAHILPTQGSW